MTPIAFELTCIVLFLITCALIIFRYKNQRDYWYALIGLSLCFAFEPLLDLSCGWALRYSWGFVMFPGTRIPLVMPLAYGWFYGLALILMIRNEDRIDALSLWKQPLILLSIFIVWDIVLEYPFASMTSYKYCWPEKWMLHGLTPIFAPILMAVSNVATYYVHKFALRYSKGKSWGRGLLIHILAYYSMFAVATLLLFLLVKILGIHPTAAYYK